VGVALRKLGLTGHEAVMIGETPYDAEAASGQALRRRVC